MLHCENNTNTAGNSQPSRKTVMKITSNTIRKQLRNPTTKHFNLLLLLVLNNLNRQYLNIEYTGDANKM